MMAQQQGQLALCPNWCPRGIQDREVEDFLKMQDLHGFTYSILQDMGVEQDFGKDVDLRSTLDNSLTAGPIALSGT